MPLRSSYPHDSRSRTTGSREADPRASRSRTSGSRTSGSREPRPRTPQRKKHPFLVVLILLAAVVLIILSRRPAPETKKSHYFSKTEDLTKRTDDIRELLKKQENWIVKDDIRVIFADYEDRSSDTPDATRKRSERLQSEFADALAKKEPSVCVIGWHSSILSGYSNSSTPGYDNGSFRSLPYSSFWLKSYRSGSSYLPSEGSSLGVRFTLYEFEYYDMTDQEITAAKAKIDAETQSILSCIPQGADLWQKARTIHDELVARLSYDHDFEDHCHDLYGAFGKHKTVCEGYALAFQYLMERAGESCNVVISDWDETTDVSHAWNELLGVYGDDRYIDVTWDDMDYADENGDPYILYNYFGLTLDELNSIDAHSVAHTTQTTWSETPPNNFNYYRHEGYELAEFDVDAVVGAFRDQYERGANSLTVRFSSEEAYREAVAYLSDGNTLYPLLNNIGYEGKLWYTFNETTYTCTFGLGEYTES